MKNKIKTIITPERAFVNLSDYQVVAPDLILAYLHNVPVDEGE